MHDSGPGNSVSVLVLNSVLELAIILVSDLFLRPYFRRNFQQEARRRNKFNLLVTQEVLLLISIVVLLLFHHIPYIIMAGAAVILFRAVQLKWFVGIETTRHASMRPVVSRSIRHGIYGPLNSNRTPEPMPMSQPQQCTDNHSMPNVVANNQVGVRVEHSASAYSGPQPTHELIRHRMQSHPKISSYSATGLAAQESRTSLEVSCSQSTIEPRVSLTNVQKESYPSYEEPVSNMLQIVPVKLTADHIEQVSNQFSTLSQSARNDFLAERTGYEYPIAPSTTPPGLINSGNTCFVNSTLQCLNWTPGFIEVLPKFGDTNEPLAIFCRELNNIFHTCSSSLPDGKTKFKPISTETLLSSTSLLASHLVAPANSGQHQQDAAEYLLWLLDHLHGILVQANGRPTDINIEGMLRDKKTYELQINQLGSSNLVALIKPMTELSEVDWNLNWHKHSSTLYNLFLGQILEARECQSCRKVTMNIEYFTLLPLPLPANQASSLDKCFRRFSELEELVQDNMISCSCMSGDLVPATRLALLSIIPKSLIIQLTRFSYNSILHRALKNDTPVYFPQRMDIFPYTMKAKLNCTEKQQDLYELHAFCVHSGAQSTSYGHYMAYCRASNNQWYQFNDQHVTHIKDIDVILSSEFVLRNAYLLFYHSMS